MLSAQQCERLASETAEQREARLSMLSAQQCERLASETGKQREARLSVLSAQQRERLASLDCRAEGGSTQCVECSTV